VGGEHAEVELNSCDKLLVVLGKGNTVKVWDLATATLCAELKDFTAEDMARLSNLTLSQDRRFLICEIEHETSPGIYIYDLITGQMQRIHDEDCMGIVIGPDSQTIALDLYLIPSGAPLQESWWKRFSEWLGIQKKYEEERVVVLKSFPSEKEIFVLKNCTSPVFSPDGKTLVVVGIPDANVQLWDLPIRKSIGKILSLAALAAVATLLAFNGLGWLRWRMIKTAVTPASQ
jgi:WD40 repeat protein